MPFSYDPEAYLGNPHLDLANIFDGDLENININRSAISGLADGKIEEAANLMQDV